MAKMTSIQISIQDDPEVDDCQENIAPGASAAAQKLKNQGDMAGYCSRRPSRESKPIPDNYTFSTPSLRRSSGEFKEKSSVSGLQLALTPVLKCSNVDNKSWSPTPLKDEGNPHLNSPFYPTTSSSNPSNSDLTCRHPSVSFLDDEYLPEVTLFDLTCDSTMQLIRNESAFPDSVPATPTGNSKSTTVQPSLLRPDLNNTAQKSLHQMKTLDPLPSAGDSLNVESKTTCQLSKYNVAPVGTNLNSTMFNTTMRASAPVDFLDFPEITLLDVTHDSYLSPGVEISSICIAQDVSPRDGLKESTSAQPEKPDKSQIDFSSSPSCNVTATLTSNSEKSDKCVVENVVNASLTQDVSTGSVLEMSRASPEPSEQNMVKSQTSPKDTQGTHPVNVTHDISFSTDTSAVSQFSTFDMQDNVTSKMDNSELHSGHGETSGFVDAKNEQLSSDEAQETNQVFKPSPKTTESANNTFTVAQPDLDLSAGNETSHKAADIRDQASSVSGKTAEMSLDKHQNDSDDKARGSCDVQNTTFDMHSIQKSHESTSLGEAFATSLCLQNNTFNSEPASKQNGTITLSETSSSDSHHDTLDKPSPSIVCTSSTSPKDNNSGVLTSDTEHNSIAASADCNNKMVMTLEIPSEVNPDVEAADKTDTDIRDQGSSVSGKATEISLGKHQNDLDDKARALCDVQCTTFDMHSIQKSRDSTSLGEAFAAPLCLRNNTFNSEPASKQNGTIILSETSSSGSHHNTLDKPSPSKVCTSSTSPKENNSGVLTSDPEHNSIAATADCNNKIVLTLEIASEVNPDVEAASGHSFFCDSVGDQSMDTMSSKDKPFNSDDTLFLPSDILHASTPMVNCGRFSLYTERKGLGAQKKLYGEGAGRPDVQVTSDVPFNIVSDRNTFLTQPTVKSLLPPLKTASQLLKYKPASILPGKFEPSGLTRQRTQAEVQKNTAVPDATPGNMGISSSYKLRSTTTASKHPSAGLPRPQLTNISSGIQKTAQGLRPPTTRSNAHASLSNDKLPGSTASNHLMKISQLLKHPLTRGESLPSAKRKKIEAPLPSVCTEASASSCVAVNRPKTLKQPTAIQRPLPANRKRDDAAVPVSTAKTSTSCGPSSRALKLPAPNHKGLAKPQSHGCAKCVELEEQLKMKSEELRLLKEELLKYKEKEEED